MRLAKMKPIREDRFILVNQFVWKVNLNEPLKNDSSVHLIPCAVLRYVWLGDF